MLTVTVGFKLKAPMPVPLAALKNSDAVVVGMVKDDGALLVGALAVHVAGVGGHD